MDPKRKSYFLGSILLLFVLVDLSSQAPKSRKTIRRQNQPSKEDTLVEETDRLLTAGESITKLHAAKRDIVLVIGNTGAGKTTVTKFLAEVNNLESYDAGDRYLIRDKDQKISVNSTMVSKTIFPDLIIDPVTGTVFYDLPGFSDTRNASIEIANACFMKKVADHANRVKLLFIVNYGSLRSGETRTDFKTFLEHATDLVRNPLKFKASIALVATKVEVNRNQAKIIQGIAAYLQAAKTSLEQIFSEESRRKAAADLIDAFLSKDPMENYNRISYFKQPDDEGPLTSLPDVMAQRSHIQTVLDDNIIYSPKSAENFGFSVSPAAKLIITKLAEKIHQKLVMTISSIAHKMESKFLTYARTSPWSSLGTLVKEQQRFQKLAEALMDVQTLEEFRQSLQTMTSPLQMAPAISAETAEWERRQNNLEFLEQINGNAFPPSILELSLPVQEAVKRFGLAISQKAADFGIEIEKQISSINEQIMGNFNAKLGQMAQNEQKLEESERISSGLNGMIEKVSTARSVNSFKQQVQTYLNVLDAQVSTSGLIELSDDIKFEPGLPFNILMWTSPFEKLLTKLRELKNNIHIQVLMDKNEHDRAQLQADMKAFQEVADKERDTQNRRMAQMAMEMEEERKRWQANIEDMRKNHQAQMAQTQATIGRLQDEISRQERSSKFGAVLGAISSIATAAINKFGK